MRNKLFIILSLVMVASMILAACGATPTPGKIIETVEVKVVETVEVVKEGETVVVTATPAPEEPLAKPAVLRINLGTFPDVVDPQKSSFVNEIAHLKLIYEGLTKFNTKLCCRGSSRGRSLAGRRRSIRFVRSRWAAGRRSR